MIDGTKQVINQLTSRCSCIVKELLARKNKMTIPPKAVALNGDESPDVTESLSDRMVLIDDDFLIRMGWETEAGEKNIKIDTFDSSREFLRVLSQYAKSTKIYVDVSLGNGDESGEALAQRLHELGYNAIYLATSYNKECFGHMPWLRGIQGKNPPF